MNALATRGWARFPATPESRAWARAGYETGRAVLADPEIRRRWLQCEGTWFVGVDALPTSADGAIQGVPLAGPAIEALSPLPYLHRAQLSVTFPGYPRPREGESEAAFGYRKRRDAAHVDGITADGPERRRRITEPHAFILGLPLNAAPPGASPLVVWEGSQRIMGDALRTAFAEAGAVAGDAVDVTEPYQAARRRVFDSCARVELPAEPGEALVLHRHILHGIAPWRADDNETQEGRMIAYFRPLVAAGLGAWLGKSVLP